MSPVRSLALPLASTGEIGVRQQSTSPRYAGSGCVTSLFSLRASVSSSAQHGKNDSYWYLLGLDKMLYARCGGRGGIGRARPSCRPAWMTADNWPPLRRGHSFAFQAEGCGGGPHGQQPHARPALPPTQRPAPPRPGHVRLFPPVGDLADRPRGFGGSAAAPDQV